MKRAYNYNTESEFLLRDLYLGLVAIAVSGWAAIETLLWVFRHLIWGLV
jgi:hypothetical protein